jgi:parvulin-like peptidyl-prolyl isomerase
MITMRKSALCFCLLLSFAVAASGQQAPSLPPLATGDLPEVVARVNGDEIHKVELIAQAQTMRVQAVRAGAGDPAQSEQFLRQVLDTLIGEQLFDAESKSRGFEPTPAEIDQRVQQVIAAWGGEEGFERALQAQGLDRQYVRKEVIQTLTFEKVMEREIKPAIKISEEEVQGYYEQYKDQLRVPATYKLRQIRKILPADASAEAKAAARAQLEELRRQASGGADFAALAREHSDDEKTREQGGEMPWIVLTGRGGGVDQVIAGLEVGQMSEVFESDAGLHLLRLDDRKPERVKTLEEARQEITEVLTAARARQEIQRRVESLKAAASVEILM